MSLFTQIQLHDHSSVFGVAEVLFAIAAEAGFTVVSRGRFASAAGTFSLSAVGADALFAVVFGADGDGRCFLDCAASAVFGAAFAGSEGLLLVPES